VEGHIKSPRNCGQGIAFFYHINSINESLIASATDKRDRTKNNDKKRDLEMAGFHFFLFASFTIWTRTAVSADSTGGISTMGVGFILGHYRIGLQFDN
jgi:hypothetical protein